MTPLNRTRLVLSIWWHRQVLAGFRQPREDIVTVLFLTVSVGFPIFMGFVLFPLGHAMDAYAACVTGSPLPVVVGHDWAAGLERFSYVHMASVNLIGLGLAFWTVWYFADTCSKPGPPPANNIWGRVFNVALLVVPLGLSVPWLVPAILLYFGSHFPRGVVLGVFHAVRWTWSLPGRWHARCTQLLEDNPDMAVPAARSELDGQLPMAESRINPARRL